MRREKTGTPGVVGAFIVALYAHRSDYLIVELILLLMQIQGLPCGLAKIGVWSLRTRFWFVVTSEPF